MNTPSTLQNLLSFTLAAGLLAAAPTVRADEGRPSVIRIGFPGTGTGNRPVLGGAALSTAHLKGWVEQEFQKDGIRIEWNHFKYAGPGINEAFANGLLDFSVEGDLGMIIGRSAGLHTKVLAGDFMRGRYAVAVPSESSIRTLADLKGRRFAVAKGTAIQLCEVRALAKVGLQDKDVRAVNILGANATDALQTKDIDAVIGTPAQFFPLRDRGVARIIYESNTPEEQISGGFVGDENFIRKYPEITRRLLKLYVKAARFGSDEANRNTVFALWGQDGTGFQYYKESYRKDTMIEHQTPLLDDYWVGRFQDGVAEALKYKLIRKPFDIERWLDRNVLDAALKDLGLEHYWTPYRRDGRPLTRS